MTLAKKKGFKSITDVISIAGGMTVLGRSQLKRRPGEIKLKIWTSGIPANTATTGKVVKSERKAKFSARLREGDASNSLFSGGRGLLDALKAEIHLVVRSHGPAIPGQTEDQITTFGGGCNEATGGGDGAVGFACEDLQFGIHLPPQADRDEDDDDDDNDD